MASVEGGSFLATSSDVINVWSPDSLQAASSPSASSVSPVATLRPHTPGTIINQIAWNHNSSYTLTLFYFSDFFARSYSLSSPFLLLILLLSLSLSFSFSSFSSSFSLNRQVIGECGRGWRGGSGATVERECVANDSLFFFIPHQRLLLLQLSSSLYLCC
jgi:hypothetical protein